MIPPGAKGIFCPMSQPGRFRIPSRNRAYETHLHPAMRAARRVERILDSLRAEIEGGEVRVRVRQIFERPREIFRLEIDQPAWGYQRTTLLDREALEELLAQDGVRDRIEEPFLRAVCAETPALASVCAEAPALASVGNEESGV